MNNKTTQELWLPIKGYIGRYEVSNKGRIKSLLYKKVPILKLRDSSNGYKNVLLTSKDGKERNFKVSRLVSTAFIPNPSKKPQVNHKDFNKFNDSVENLEWCTNEENKQHSAKLKAKDVDEIRRLKTSFPSIKYTELSKKFGVTRQHIRDIILGKTWKNYLPNDPSNE